MYRILFFILISFIFLQIHIAGCKTKEKEYPNKAYVVFIQSDLVSTHNTDKSNFLNIWSKIVPDLLYEISKRQNFICYFFPLNAKTRDANLLSYFTSEELHYKTDYRKKKIIKEKINRLINNHIKILQIEKKENANDNDKVRVHRNAYQDIYSSYFVLKNLRDEFNNKHTKTLTVIYISDMVHYNSRQITDAENGYFDFTNEYSFEQFEKNIIKGILYKDIKLISILTGTSIEKFIVYSISLPRGIDREELPINVRNKLYDVWRVFFEKIGATKINLNLINVPDLK